MTSALAPPVNRPQFKLTLFVGLALLIGTPIVWLGGQFFFTEAVPTNGCIGDRWDCAVSPRQKWRWSLIPLVQIAMALGAFTAWLSAAIGYLWVKDKTRNVLSFVALVIITANTAILSTIAIYFLLNDCVVVRGMCLRSDVYAVIYGVPAIIFAVLLTVLTVGIFKRKTKTGKLLLTGSISVWSGLAVAQLAWLLPLFSYI